MIDPVERALLAETVAAAIAAAAEQPAAAVDGALAELGWLEMLAAEPADAIAIVFDALGSTNAQATALDDVIVHALGLQPHPGLAVVFPPFAAWDPPGSVGNGRVQARGLASARATTASELVVVAATDREPCAVVVPAASARITTVRGVDPAAELRAVDVDTGIDTDGPAARIPVPWDGAVALSQRAVAHQIAGATRAMLDLARLHARERVQFGRPVARFQAVRHRLADALVAIEALDATLAAAADAPEPETAALAKAVAGRTARTVAAHCQQVLAGIGFTTDHPFHRYLGRTMLLDGLFGAADALVLATGRRLLAERSVPTLIEL
ncbi:MAG TPA: acyl-CoA dehydrogenase family protein [Acidimicrobiia bacterium]|nr:acyl-CoA dehydrogenase family protein [Acidimicrobiia bacterium]